MEWLRSSSRRVSFELSAELLAAHNYSSLTDAVAKGDGEGLLRSFCDIFDVSMQMVLYRVLELKLLPKDTAQTELGW